MDDDAIKRLRKLAERAVSKHERLPYLHTLDAHTIFALLDEREALRRERDAQKRVIDDAYAALGGDAWWMDPPDGGSPTLAEMVAKANEDGRALYYVRKERDAAMALLRLVQDGIDDSWRTFPEGAAIVASIAALLSRWEGGK